MIKIKTMIVVFVLELISLSLQATPEKTMSPVIAPSKTTQLFFKSLNPQQSTFTLSNIFSGENIEFTVQNDELVTQAVLHLKFTPSPALIPLLSQLKVYLNDELVQIIAISAQQLGQLSSVEVPIDSRYIKDFNRLQLVFTGHYQDVCENPIHSSIWIDLDKLSFLELTIQRLLLNNDLAHFPEPFFDPLNHKPLELPMVFAGQPDILQQQAAAILASWFGSQALWRGVSFSVLFHELPERNAIVFATNEQRPDFLKDYSAVNAPTIQLISHPKNPYVKLLLILGRDDHDLLTAVRGIAQGNILFRGSRVVVDKVQILKPRKPYDAPNWIPTDRPVSFAQLKEFDDQLQTKGYSPYPISLRFNVPPDLYLDESRGIALHLNYRYSSPPATSLSQLDISLNHSFIKSYPLETQHEKLFSSKVAKTSQKLYIPVKELGAHNQLTFLFDYGSQSAGGMKNGQCITYNLLTNYGVIDDSSTLDFSNYYHDITMPNLSAFITSGFPFSIFADLSHTLVYLHSQPNPESVATLLNVLGTIGAATGYPALGVMVTDDWSVVKQREADVLTIGALPEELRHHDAINLLLNHTQDWIKEPLTENELLFNTSETQTNVSEEPETQTTVSARGPLAALLGLQSPYYKNRSIVSLLAETTQDFVLLNKALTETKNFNKIYGSVAVIRDTGIDSLRVGSTYSLSNLPWWIRFWLQLQEHPVNLALIAFFAAIIVSLLLWSRLLVMSRRRLNEHQHDK